MPQSYDKKHKRQDEAQALHDANQPTTPTPPAPTTETDPVFTASEAAKFVPGDKANLDNLIATVAAQAGVIANQATVIVNLQTQIDALMLRVAALEPHDPEATGFADARANGKLTKSYDWNGYPTYTTPSGARYYVADMDHYRVDLSGGTMNTDYVNPVSGTVLGAYNVSMGMSPAGTVA